MIFLRIVGILLGLLGVVGFGVCGFFGVGLSLSTRDNGGVMFFGLLGVAISALLAGLVWRGIKTLVKPKDTPAS